MIKCTESKKEKRSFVIKRDSLPDEHNLYGYSIFDSTEKRRLYRLKTIYSDIDIMVVVDLPAKNIVANLEGVLLEGKLNITFSIYDYTLSKWTDGAINETYDFLLNSYTIDWNSEQFLMKNKDSSTITTLHNKSRGQLIAEFQQRTRWLDTSPFIYDLEVYSDELPDAVYFFALTVIDHRIFHS